MRALESSLEECFALFLIGITVHVWLSFVLQACACVSKTPIQTKWSEWLARSIPNDLIVCVTGINVRHLNAESQPL